MRILLPFVLAVACFGCVSESTLGVDVVVTGIMNPRPLEASTQVDRIVQIAQPEVDALWVISNRTGMDLYQARLARHAPLFFDVFARSGMDYHLGVVSTAMLPGTQANGWNGQLVTKGGHRFIDPDTPDAEGVFTEMMLQVNAEHGYEEKSHDATYAAMETERHGYNLGFLRERSSVHVIAIVAANEYSALTPLELADYLNGLRSDPDDVTYSSITYNAAEPEYVVVTERVGGTLWDINDPDWTGMIEQLAVQATGLEQEFYLSRLPVPGTIEVSVVDGNTTHGFDEGEDWTYDPVRNSIRFQDYVPNHLAEIVLEYEPLASDHGV